MIDWHRSMNQSYEFYIVNPNSWSDVEKLDDVKSCNINGDLDSSTIYSATISMSCEHITDEQYIRIYLICIQDNMEYRFPLATVLVQSPSESFDGIYRFQTLDAYSPLLELKDVPPPIGYTILKNTNIMDSVVHLCSENSRCEVVKCTNPKTLENDFVASTDDTWLSFILSLASMCSHYVNLDGYGKVLFNVQTELDAMYPIFTFNDDNSSILYPEASQDIDFYGIPNVVEVIYSVSGGSKTVVVENTNPDSRLSIPNRGRKVVKRIIDPNFGAIPSTTLMTEYANKVLKDYSTMECTITFKHGYCGVGIGDVIRLNYEKNNLVNIKAKIVRQNISCVAGCVVQSTAIYTKKLWEGN